MAIPQNTIQILPISALRPALTNLFAPRRTAFVISLACFVLLASAVSLAAQQPISLADADLRAQTIFQQSAVTGMVLVVVRSNQVMIKTYGETFPGSGHAPDPNSLIRLCSISKVFTADLLMKLAAYGKVGLTDPLQRYAPHGALVPKGADGTPITLLDLATHTSGLPREVSAYPAKIPHFTFPDRAFRWAWLPKQKLISTPGTAALYSNVGFDLLGDALAAASHKSYAHLVHDSVLRPLDMWDTTLVPSAEQCARLLRGTSDEGPCTDTQASGPSGGIYSTATDMAKFLRYLLHTPGSVAQPVDALAVYRKPQQLKSMQGLSHAGEPTGVGLAWIQLGDPTSPSMVMQKTGGGAGFSTYIALNPATETGIFIAAADGNGHAQIDFFHESNNLLAALANVAPLPPMVHIDRAAVKHPKTRRRKGTTAAGSRAAQ